MDFSWVSEREKREIEIQAGSYIQEGKKGAREESKRESVFIRRVKSEP